MAERIPADGKRASQPAGVGYPTPAGVGAFPRYVETVQTGERRIAVVQRIGTTDFTSTGAMAALCLRFKIKEKL
jgi:hypothetical protein